MNTQHTPEAALTAIGKAKETVSSLCNGDTRWTLSVPARPESDPDLVISRALVSAEKAINRLEQQHADLLAALEAIRRGYDNPCHIASKAIAKAMGQQL